MVALAAALAFRAIAVAVFAVGIAALVAPAAMLPFASEEQLRWFASIPARAAAIGAIFLGASVGSFVMMPRHAALVRRSPPAPDRPPPPAGFPPGPAAVQPAPSRSASPFDQSNYSVRPRVSLAPHADPVVRSLAMALAPILELRSRLRSERHNT